MRKKRNYHYLIQEDEKIALYWRYSHQGSNKLKLEIGWFFDNL
jgi:hypothetical protein